jgi:hypothetical protein
VRGRQTHQLAHTESQFYYLLCWFPLWCYFLYPLPAASLLLLLPDQADRELGVIKLFLLSHLNAGIMAHLSVGVTDGEQRAVIILALWKNSVSFYKSQY